MSTQTKPPKPNKKRIILTTLLIIFAAACSFGVYYFIVSDRYAHEQFSKVSDEALRIEQVGIKPLGGIFVKEVAKGDGLISDIKCIPDVKCPTIQKTWYVVVEDGKEGDVLRSVLQKTGYPIKNGCYPNDVTSCDFITSNDNYDIILSLNKKSSLKDNVGVWKELSLNIQPK